MSVRTAVTAGINSWQSLLRRILFLYTPFQPFLFLSTAKHPTLLSRIPFIEDVLFRCIYSR